MRRLLSLATAVTLTTTVLAIPATAHAEVTLTRVTTEFDRLAPERVATITVAAASAAGVKEIRAELHHVSPANAPYATLTEFVRTAGTDENGTWQAVYRTDTEARPGSTIIKVTVTGQDGTTSWRSTSFRDCYVTDIVDLTAQPAAIDVDHQTATVRGRLVFRKSRAEEPQPVRSARVATLGGLSETTTGADGGFSLNVQGPDDAGVSFPPASTLCSWAERAPITMQQQATQVKAWLTSAQPMPAGNVVAISGTATRQAATGTVPAGDVDVSLKFQGRSGAVMEQTARTGANGAFEGMFFPRESGRWSAWIHDSRFYKQSPVAGGDVTVGRRTVQITGSNAGPEPVARRDMVTVTGTLKEVGAGPIKDTFVHVEFSANGKTGWKKMGEARSDDNGKVTTYTNGVQASGYWRLRFPGDVQNTPATGWADHVEVRDRTYIYNFNASPEPVRKGRTVTVKGDLHRMTGKPAGTMAGQKVYFYFLPKGAKKWTYLASATTDRKGHFSRGFKAVKDGTWRAYYAGSPAYLKWHADDYVDVR
ncbi:hypothetical protein ACFVH6_14175 [Spirillospora sp. NPDC127200]